MGDHATSYVHPWHFNPGVAFLWPLTFYRAQHLPFRHYFSRWGLEEVPRIKDLELERNELMSTSAISFNETLSSLGLDVREKIFLIGSLEQRLKC